MASIDDQAAVWRRNLHELRMKAAGFGGSMYTPVSLSNQIDEMEKKLNHVEDIKHQLSLLEINRRNARMYLQQINSVGAQHASPMHLNGLKGSREAIKSIKKTLQQYYAYHVDPAPEDEEAPTETAYAPMPSIEEDNLMAMIRQGLRTLEQMVQHDQKSDALNQIRLLQRLVR